MVRPPDRTLPVVLALCCVLAGCNAVGGGAGTATPASPSDASGAVTPAPVPEDPTRSLTGTPDGPTSVAGPTTEGFRNATAVLDAHRAALSNRSVTVRYGRATRHPNGTVARSVTGRVAVAGDRSRYNRTSLVRGGDGTDVVGHWSNGTVAYRRFGTGPDANVTRVTPAEFETVSAMRPALPLLADDLAPANTTVERLRDGRAYVVVVTGVEPVDARFSNGTLTMVVADRGFVERYRFAVDRECDGGSCRFVRTATFGAVGETSVERPAWAANATTEAGRADTGAGTATATVRPVPAADG